MGKKFWVRFRGVRGSYPSPGRKMARYGGNTSCVEVWVDGHLIVLDAGSGIISLGDDLIKQHAKDRKPLFITLLLTHLHHDHIQGFPFFKPAYLGDTRLFAFGPRGGRLEFKEIMSRAMTSPFFPVEMEELKSFRNFRTLQEAEVVILDHGQPEPRVRHVFREEKVKAENPVIITVLKNYAHPKDGTYVYKIRWKDKFLVYATDIEGYVGGDTRLISFARGADLLIHDAQYKHEEYTRLIAENISYVQSIQGFGHSTPEIAVEAARKAEVKKLALFHHDPSHTDEHLETIEKECKRKFPNTFAAREGQKVTL